MEELYIALIDDDEDDLVLLKESFKIYNNISVHGFSNGKKFLDSRGLVNGEYPCLLVIDLNLPDIRGLDLVVKIKSTPVLDKIPIIVYTNGYSRAELEQCKKLQIEIFKKPATVQEWEEIALMMANHCNNTVLNQ